MTNRIYQVYIDETDEVHMFSRKNRAQQFIKAAKDDLEKEAGQCTSFHIELTEFKIDEKNIQLPLSRKKWQPA